MIKYVLGIAILFIGILIGMIIELAIENVKIIKQPEPDEEEYHAEITKLKPNDNGDYFRPF